MGTTLGGCGGSKAQQQQAPALPVDVAVAKRADIATTIVLDGQIAPMQQSTLGSTQSATLSDVLVNEGDSVRKGQLLAKLDTSQLEAQLAGYEASVAQSQAKLSGSSVTAPVNAQQYSSAVSQAQLNLTAGRNAVASNAAALRNAALINRSNAALLKQGYVSQTTAEQANASYVAAAQQLASSQAALAALEAALQTARTNTQQSKVDQSTIGQDRAALAQAQANVKLTQTDIDQSSIYAPFDGVVTQRLLDPGAFAGPNAPIVQVSQIDTVFVNANVPDEDLGYVQAGRRATFTTPSIAGKTFAGVVHDVNATPTTGTLTYRARLIQSNPGNVLRGGMLVSVVVDKERRSNVIVVPLAAVSTGDRGASVYTVQNGRAKMLPVTVGLQTDTLAQISGPGVAPGLQVITTRPDALQNGSQVAVAGTPPNSK